MKASSYTWTGIFFAKGHFVTIFFLKKRLSVFPMSSELRHVPYSISLWNCLQNLWECIAFLRVPIEYDCLFLCVMLCFILVYWQISYDIPMNLMVGMKCESLFLKLLALQILKSTIALSTFSTATITVLNCFYSSY